MYQFYKNIKILMYQFYKNIIILKLINFCTNSIMVDKKPITWIEFVKIKKGQNKSKHLKEVLKMAGSEWKKVKAGTHSEYTQGKCAPRTRKKHTTSKKKKKGKKGSAHDEADDASHSTRKTHKCKKCVCANLRHEIKILKEKLSELE